MTDYRVYVGEVIDPELSWDELGDGWHTNVRELHRVTFGMDALLRVMGQINSGELEGQQVDWGAWVAKISKEELVRRYPAQAKPIIDPVVYRPFMQGLSDEEIVHRMNLNPGEKLEQLPEGEYLLVAVEGV